MKNVRSNEAPLFERVFADIKTKNSDIVIWQVSPTNGRKIHYCTLTEFDLAAGHLNFKDENGNSFHFEDLEVFFYSEDNQVIFKSKHLGQNGNLLGVEIPEEIRLLEGPDINVIKSSLGIPEDEVWRVKSLGQKKSIETYWRGNVTPEVHGDLTIKEEDKLFANLREAPRAKPVEDKFITCAVESNPESAQIYKLFDLSRGGMGFLCMDENHFSKGTFIVITEVEGEKLEKSMRGEVMSVRGLAPEAQGFKVGVKFID